MLGYRQCFGLSPEWLLGEFMVGVSERVAEHELRRPGDHGMGVVCEVV